jgi:hypothetical protein
MDSENKNILHRLAGCFKSSWRKALKTAWWMIRLMLPISLGVMLLQYFGILQYISTYLTPVFQHIGLPGESALVYITSFCLSIYAAIAVIGTLALDMREITILAIMCLIAHNMFIETAIQKRTGSSPIRIVLVRIISSFAAAIIFNWLLPKTGIIGEGAHKEIQYTGLLNLLETWFAGSFWLSAKIVLLVTGLMFLQKILDEFGFMDILSKIFKPFMKPMGLSNKISFHWIIANTIGLTYGSAIMFDQVETGKISLKDADYLNQHIAVSHSLLEDTLLFVAIGVSAWWITFPRIAIGIIVVWLYRLEQKIFKIKKGASSPGPLSVGKGELFST